MGSIYRWHLWVTAGAGRYLVEVAIILAISPDQGLPVRRQQRSMFSSWSRPFDLRLCRRCFEDSTALRWTGSQRDRVRPLTPRLWVRWQVLSTQHNTELVDAAAEIKLKKAGDSRLCRVWEHGA